MWEQNAKIFLLVFLKGDDEHAAQVTSASIILQSLFAASRVMWTGRIIAG